MIEIRVLEVEISPYSEKLEEICRDMVKKLTEGTEEELRKYRNVLNVEVKYGFVPEKENNRVFVYIPMLIPKVFTKIPIWGKKKIEKQIDIVMTNLKNYLKVNGLDGLSYKYRLLKS